MTQTIFDNQPFGLRQGPDGQPMNVGPLTADSVDEASVAPAGTDAFSRGTRPLRPDIVRISKSLDNIELEGGASEIARPSYIDYVELGLAASGLYFASKQRKH